MEQKENEFFHEIKRVPAFVITVIHRDLISSDSACNNNVCGAPAALLLLLVLLALLVLVLAFPEGITVISKTKERLLSLLIFTEDIKRFHRFLIIYMNFFRVSLEKRG